MCRSCTVALTVVEWCLQAVKIRSAQGQASAQSCLLPTAALTAPQLERLRHAFELLCEGSGQQAGVTLHQLPEIMVMAGMDLSAPDTANALTEMVRAPIPLSISPHVPLPNCVTAGCWEFLDNSSAEEPEL